MFGHAFEMLKFNTQKVRLKKNIYVWKKIESAFKSSKSLKIVKIYFYSFFNLKFLFLKCNFKHALNQFSNLFSVLAICKDMTFGNFHKNSK
jgi:hypothetical protein